MPATIQQSISLIHLTLKTPQNKNTAFPQTTIQSTVKLSGNSKYSQMNLDQERNHDKRFNKKKSKRDNFSDHNYNFFAKNEKTKTPINEHSKPTTGTKLQSTKTKTSLTLSFFQRST